MICTELKTIRAHDNDLLHKSSWERHLYGVLAPPCWRRVPLLREQFQREGSASRGGRQSHGSTIKFGDADSSSLALSSGVVGQKLRALGFCCPIYATMEWGRRVEVCRKSGYRVSEWSAEKLLIGTNFSALDSPLSLKLPLLRAYSTTPSERKLSAKKQKSFKNDLCSFAKCKMQGQYAYSYPHRKERFAKGTVFKMVSIKSLAL